MSTDRLIYLPLGGAGEIGMNCYVYGYGPEGAERLIVVDLGVTFPDMDSTPGVDLIFPDIAWLEACKDRIEAIFITHAHEDHVGAVGHLWEKLGAPIYARAFTSNIARRKMEEHGYSEATVRTVQPWPDTVAAGTVHGWLRADQPFDSREFRSVHRHAQGAVGPYGRFQDRRNAGRRGTL